MTWYSSASADHYAASRRQAVEDAIALRDVGSQERRRTMIYEGKPEPSQVQARRAAVAALVVVAVLYGLIGYSLWMVGPQPRVMTATAEARPWYEAMQGQWTWLHDEYLRRESEADAGERQTGGVRGVEGSPPAWVEHLMGAQ